MAIPDELAEQCITTALPFGQSHYIYLAPLGDGVQVRLWHDITKTTLDGPVIVEGSVSGLELCAGREAGEFFISGMADGKMRHLKLTYARDERRLSVIDFAVIGIYLISLIWIGLYFAKREKTSEDYFTKRASLVPAFIGAAAGTVVVLLLTFKTGASFFIYQGCGIMTTFIVGYLVSLFVLNPLDVSELTVHDLPERAE